MAKPGFGKRSAGDTRSPADFTHLPVREAYLAAFIDQLPEGAAMDVKTLAKAQPLYGQQACRSALRELSRVGHLRRVGGMAGPGRPQHVTRTYFSRTARDEAWWTAFLEGRHHVVAAPVTAEPTPPASVPAPSPSPAPTRRHRSEAYEALATLGQRDPRLILSAAECTALEPLASEWLARGVSLKGLALALASGLPPTVHSPVGILRKRLTDKLPPEPVQTRPPTQPRLLLECTGCGAPGAPAALPGGLCRRCRSAPDPDDSGGLLTAGQARLALRAALSERNLA